MKNIEIIYLDDLKGIKNKVNNFQKVLKSSKCYEIKDLKDYEGIYYTLNSKTLDDLQKGNYDNKSNICFLISDENKIIKTNFSNKIQILCRILDENKPIYTKVYTGKTKKTCGLYIANPYEGKYVYVKQQLKDHPFSHSDPFEYVDLEKGFLYTSKIFGEKYGYNLEKLNKIEFDVTQVLNGPHNLKFREELDKKPYSFVCKHIRRREVYSVLENYENKKENNKVKTKK